MALCQATIVICLGALVVQPPTCSLSRPGEIAHRKSLSWEKRIGVQPWDHTVHKAQVMESFYNLSAEEKKEFLSTIAEHPDAPEELKDPEPMQLFWYFVISAVPMVGFGFTDNVIMILAGDVIETHIGGVLHLSTMAAAGLGNMFSDVAGVGLSGVIESGADKIGIPAHNLTPAQLELTQSRVIGGISGAIGIAIGCLLGMIPLYFTNPEKTKLKVLFDSIDTDKSGNIEPEELRKGFASINVFLAEEELTEMLKNFDKVPPYGALDFKEFEAMFKVWKKDHQDKFLATNGKA